MKRVLVLASGRGTDFQALIDHERLQILQGLQIAGLLVNHPKAPVVERALGSGIRVFELEGVTGRKFPTPGEKEKARESFDGQCLKIIRELQVDYVALAGFDQIVSRFFVEQLPFQILNIHPAIDLVSFGGKNMVGSKVHDLVLKSQAKYSGCTVHFVTADVDLGPPILKKLTPIEAGETVQSLEKKILALEHLAYPQALQLLADDRVLVSKDGKSCFVDQLSDNWDIKWFARQQKYLETLSESV